MRNVIILVAAALLGGCPEPYDGRLDACLEYIETHPCPIEMKQNALEICESGDPIMKFACEDSQACPPNALCEEV